MQPPEDPWRRGPWAENNSFTPEVRLGSPSHIDGILQWLSACKMLTTTQSHLPYKRENADVHSQSLLETHKPFRLRPDLNPDSEVLLSKFHNPVFWTAIGILSASWTEYTRQQLPAGDKRQWQAEWISWAVILTVTQAVLIVQGRRTIDGAGQQTRSDSSSLGVADRNVLAVAAANTVAHALFLYYELHWTLVSWQTRPVGAVTNHVARCLAYSYRHNFLCGVPVYEERKFAAGVRSRAVSCWCSISPTHAGGFPSIPQRRHCYSRPVHYPPSYASGLRVQFPVIRFANGFVSLLPDRNILWAAQPFVRFPKYTAAQISYQSS
jgi:hypothetical protein